jgi:hypothetical protein
MTDQQENLEGAHQVVDAESVTGGFREATELLHADVESVTADRVSIEQSSAKAVSADHVSINQSGVKTVTASNATMTQSAALVFNGDDVAIHEGAIGIARAGRVDLFDSSVGLVTGPVTIGEGSARILVHLGSADGAIKPVLDTRSALALGAGFASTLVILSRLLRRLLGN